MWRLLPQNIFIAYLIGITEIATGKGNEVYGL
jgi:hypothetical protein